MTRLKLVLLTLLTTLALANPALALPGLHVSLGDDAFAGRDAPGDVTKLGVPLATPTQEGCATQLITTNFSSRAGVKPTMLVAHFTVSANKPGWEDVNAIRSWFNQSRAQASSHYIIDRAGNCKLIVPETAKAWTQGAFNPNSISIEFIAMGSESEDWWRSYNGLKKGAKVFADASKRWGIPIRLVNPDGCTPRAGVTDHNRLECGNTHWDMGPRFPMSYFISLIKKAANPDPMFKFYLRSEEGILFQTRKTVGGSADEADLYASFLEGIRAKSLTELRQDGDFVVQRKKVD